MKMRKNRLIFSGTLIDEKTKATIIIEDGILIDIKFHTDKKISKTCLPTIFVPLMFDAQVNGGFGVSIQDENIDEEKLVYLTQKFLSLGIAKWIPTIVTAPVEKIKLICEKISTAILTNSELAQHIPGIHLEGPWISPIDGPRGAHPKEYVRIPSISEWNKYKKAGRNKIIYVTLAPEVDKNFAFSKHLLAEGVKISIGHHQADIEVLEEAVRLGINIFTHLGNGIPNLIHRHNNPIWFALANDNISCSIITDGFHLPKYVMITIANAKRVGNIFLVSDTTKFLGMKPGVYKEFNNEVELCPDGKLCLKGTPYLAGSASSLLDCLNVWYRTSGWSLKSCIKACSIVPSKLLGIKFLPYRLQIGRPVNLLVLKKEIKNDKIYLTPRAVFCEGKQILLEEN